MTIEDIQQLISDWSDPDAIDKAMLDFAHKELAAHFSYPPPAPRRSWEYETVTSMMQVLRWAIDTDYKGDNTMFILSMAAMLHTKKSLEQLQVRADSAADLLAEAEASASPSEQPFLEQFRQLNERRCQLCYGEGRIGTMTEGLRIETLPCKRCKGTGLKR